MQGILICYDGSHGAECAIDVADELDVAAIVIGSRGVRGFRDLAQGSVSHDVSKHARRPLVIVPPVTT